MWDVQVEKQDLNKAGTPSPSWLLPLLHPKPIPARAFLAQADVATLSLTGAVCCGQVLLGGWGQSFLGLCCLGCLGEC